MNTYNIGDTVEVYTFSEHTGKIAKRKCRVEGNNVQYDPGHVKIKPVGVKMHYLTLGGKWPNCWLTFREAQVEAMRLFQHRERHHSKLAAKASEKYRTALRQKTA